MNLHLRLSLYLAVATLLGGPAATTAAGQDQYCGITPQSARAIATEIVRQAGHPYDSTSPAYYISVLASRLSPYYVVYFIRDGRVVGEVEVDLCGRQGTPHPGVQYAPDSDLLFAQLLLEPDQAFAALKAQKGVEAAFATRVFPYGLTRTTQELAAIDFWWLILDTQGHWHYMTRLGKMTAPAAARDASGQPPAQRR